MCMCVCTWMCVCVCVWVCLCMCVPGAFHLPLLQLSRLNIFLALCSHLPHRSLPRSSSLRHGPDPPVTLRWLHFYNPNPQPITFQLSSIKFYLIVLWNETPLIFKTLNFKSDAHGYDSTRRHYVWPEFEPFSFVSWPYHWVGSLIQAKASQCFFLSLRKQ